MRPRAADDEKVLAVDNGDVDVAWAADRFWATNDFFRSDGRLGELSSAFPGKINSSGFTGIRPPFRFPTRSSIAFLMTTFDRKRCIILPQLFSICSRCDTIPRSSHEK